MTRAIYFDMDGTIADLYGVEEWETKLLASDTAPYEQAMPLCDMKKLAAVLDAFIKKGFTVGVISWSAMNGSKEYNAAVRKAKKEWIKKYLPCVTEFHVVKYDTPKHYVRKIKNSILVDDNAAVRAKWNGVTIDASNNKKLLKNLQNLLDILD